MNRRDLLILLAALPLVGRIPAVQAAADLQTATGLRRAIEEMFAEVSVMPRAREDVMVSGFGMAPVKAEGRRIAFDPVVHFRFNEAGESEAALVRAAWRHVRKEVRGREGEKLIWRMPPIASWGRDFESNTQRARLNLRGVVVVARG